MGAMLKLSGISVGYGAIRVAKSLSMELAQGEIVAVLGANGAGKSTLLRTISGVLRPTTGEVLWRGQPIQGWPAHKIARLGIVHVPEGRGIFPELTVEENLRLGRFARPERVGEERPEISIEAVFRLFPALARRARQPAGTLSGGQQQMLAIGRGLLAQPLLLILDEPLLGLAPALAQEVLTKLREIVGLGVSVLLVEQNAAAAMAVADRAYVLAGGEIVAEGTAREVGAGKDVHRAYLGSGGGAGFRAASRTSPVRNLDVEAAAAPALAIEGLQISFGGNMALAAVTLEVREDEIVALIGPNGAGKSTLINCVAGFLAASAGTIRVFGQNVKGVPAHARCHLGLTRTFQNLQLFGTMTVLENVLAAVETRGIKAPEVVNGRPQHDLDKKDEAHRLLDRFGLERFATSRTASLPYGIRKLVELARGVGTGAKMLLLDEPAAGLNTKEKEDLTMILRRTIDERQLSVLLVEHDMSMVEALADRVYVLDAGRCIAQGSFAEIGRDPEVVRAYLGESWTHAHAVPA